MTSRQQAGQEQPIVKGTILLTGANGGIGRETVRQLLAKSPNSHYLLTVRNPDDENSALLKEVIAQASSYASTKVELIKLDLGALRDVRDAAQEIIKRVNSSELPPISHIVAQAGTQFQNPALHWSKKEPVCELTFGVNYLSHALLCLTLLPVLHPRGRFITLSSSSHDPAAGWGIPVEYKSVGEMAVPRECEADVPCGGLRRYATSKGCQTMFAVSLSEYLAESKDHEEVRSAIFEPGVNIATGLIRSVPASLRWAAHNIMGSTLITFILRRLWRSDVRTPPETGALLAEVIFDRPLIKDGCQYWAGDQPEQPSTDVLTKTKRDTLWKETQKYFVENGLMSEGLALAG